MQPKNYSNFTAKFQKLFDINNIAYTTMSAMQLPFIMNSCTTEHKLQGCTKESIFVNCFSYQSNWPYVAMSRVETRKGLFLRYPLDETKDYSVHPQLSHMIFSGRPSVYDTLKFTIYE